MIETPPELHPLIATMAFVAGLLFGSFSNVLIWRIPRGQSIWGPRSLCPSCSKVISWYDNIPLISWILLRAQCRKCKAKISIRYPLVELITAIAFVSVYLKFGLSITSLELVVFLFALIAASFIDLDHMILPDVFTLSGIVIGLLGSLVNPDRTFLASFLGVLLGGGFLWSVAYIYQMLRGEEGMGGGDIKLLAWIGAVLGWASVPFVILSASLIGSVVGLVFAVQSKQGMKTAIPFGPYLALGAVIYIFWGQTIGQWYLSFFFPSLGPL